MSRILDSIPWIQLVLDPQEFEWVPSVVDPHLSCAVLSIFGRSLWQHNYHHDDDYVDDIERLELSVSSRSMPWKWQILLYRK